MGEFSSFSLKQNELENETIDKVLYDNYSKADGQESFAVEIARGCEGCV